MKVTKLVSTCDVKDCPTIYATDRGTFLVQGETPTDHGLQIPAHETYIFEGAEQRGRAAIATMLTPGADDPTEGSEVA